MSNVMKKVQLKVISERKCYEAVDKNELPCEKRSCKQWIDHAKGKNCMFLTTQSGPLTLSEIGKIYGLTRMRICQLEKMICQKIRNVILEEQTSSSSEMEIFS